MIACVLAEEGKEKLSYRTRVSGLDEDFGEKDPGLESGDLASSLSSETNWLCDVERVGFTSWASVSFSSSRADSAPWSTRCPVALTLFPKEAVFAPALGILHWKGLEKDWGARSCLDSDPSPLPSWPCDLAFPGRQGWEGTGSCSHSGDSGRPPPPLLHSLPLPRVEVIREE